MPDANIAATFSPGETFQISISLAGKNVLLDVAVGEAAKVIQQSVSDTIRTYSTFVPNAADAAEV